MWYEKQFRDNGNLTTLLQAIRQIATFPIRIMEVCGGQTYALSRYRIEELLPNTVQMIHGPGCPVCVTHEDTISQAIEIARNPQTIFCTFGDMVRVPGTKGSLQQLKAEGKDIRIVYSPLDTLRIASENPEKQVVFFAIGFETTTPLYTLLLQEIEKILKNVEVVAEEDIDDTKINVGCHIKIHDYEYDEDLEFSIVGSTQTNSLEGKISNESPLGKIGRASCRERV